MVNYVIPLLGEMDGDATFFSGQAFRWQKSGDLYIGVVGEHAVSVSVKQGELCVSASGGSEEFWRTYFAADTDYAQLRELFLADEQLAACVRYAFGIRVLRQPFFETLCTFIISQNNNIPRITGIVKRFCECFGESLGGEQYAFPTPQIIAQQTIEALAPLRAGFRAKYLLDAAKKVASGQVTEGELVKMSSEQARASLCTILGVGPKVADCVMLFSLAKNEVIPMDVHMKKAMNERFPNGLPECIVPFGGIAQQFIFHHQRTSKDEQK